MDANELAFPSELSNSLETSYGFTKLELISAMCLQGILVSRNNGDYASEHCDNAIRHAKELLKQLNEINYVDTDSL